MKKSVSIITSILVILVIVSSCALTVFASARTEKVAFIIERIGSFFCEKGTQGDINGNDVFVYESEDEPMIDEITENVTEPEPQTEEKEICTKYVYGYSEMGQPLEAFIINGNGANDKIIFMDFAVHGFEDEYDNDGEVLVELGYSLVEYYSEHPEDLGDYRMVIVPCANPDGVTYGVNDHRAEDGDAFGRCTYAGIDINRDFKEGYFKAVESRALKGLMDEYPPSVYLNFHGWENSVLGDPDLIDILVPGLDINRGNPNWYRADDGFIMGFTKEYYGAKSALVEFANSNSVSDAQVINALNEVISSDL